MKEYRFDPNSGFIGAGNLFRVVTLKGDSIEIISTVSGESKKSFMKGDNDFIPFIEYTYWPFEIALNKTKGKVFGALSAILP